jgi:hypothetical protein
MGKEDDSRIRKQMWIDGDVQGAIVRKFCFYWAACLLFISLPLLWAAMASDPTKYVYEHFGPLWQRHWPIYVAMVALLPFTLWDALRLSHRIAGPVLRVRHQLARINSGQPFSELEFRNDDFWHDLAGQVNQLTKKTLS